MNIVKDFDPSKHGLGTLCKRGHDWNGTGKSLRYKCKRGKSQEYKYKHCVECEKLNLIARRQTPEYKAAERRKRQENREKLTARKRRYRQKNREKVNAARRKKYQDNREKVLEHQRQKYYANHEQELEKRKQYRRVNRERLREDSRRCYQNTRERAIKRTRKYYWDNVETLRLKSRIYKRENPLIVRKQKHKREALKAQCYHQSYTVDQLNLHFSKWKHKCAYCGSSEEMTIDHFIPISKGGADALFNLIPACRSCNSRKNKFDALEWYSRQPFYSSERWQKIEQILGLETKQPTFTQLSIFDNP